MFRSLYENFQNPNEVIQELNTNIARYQSVEPNYMVINTQNDYPFPNAGLNTQQSQASNVQLQTALNALGTIPAAGAIGTVNDSTDITNIGNVLTGIPDSLGERLKACRKFEGLPGLSNLMRSQTNPTALERCGWRYKSGTGAIAQTAQAAYGTRDGPLDPAVPKVDRVGGGTQYYWDLAQAEKQMVKDICKSATNCLDMTAIPISAVGEFSNVCGYCETSQKIIPIKLENGTPVARYSDFDSQCAPSKIVTVKDAKQRCPPPPPGSQDVGYWKCLNSGKLDRDCVTLSALFAGCSPEGTLVNALTRGKNNQDYADLLRNQKSFQVYQELSKTPLSEDVIRSGNATIFSAFMNNYNLNRNMYDSDNEKRWVASLDLCRYGGIYEQWNFCSDLKDSDKDYEVRCMQEQFLQAGGNPQGTDFPSPDSKSRLAGSMNWGQYKESIRKLKELTTSSDPAVQSDALNRFSGLGLSYNPTKLPRGEASQGVEVFYFDWYRYTFLGRRPYQSAAGRNLPNFNVGGGVVENTGLSDGVQFVYMCDLRPDNDTTVSFGVVTDDGWAITKNQQVFKPKDRANYFSWWYDQAPTWHNTSGIPVLADQKGVPNIFMGAWYERGGGAAFHPFYKQGGAIFDRVNQGGWIEIGRGNTPSAPIDTWWKNNSYFTQEIDAPSLQFEAIQPTGLTQPTFAERRMWSVNQLMEDRQTVPNSEKKHEFSKSSDPSLPSNTMILTLGNSGQWVQWGNIAGSACRTYTICFNIKNYAKGNSTNFCDLIYMAPATGGRRSWAVRVYDVGNPALVDLSLIYVGYSEVKETPRIRISTNRWHMAVVRLHPENSSSRSINKMDFFVQTMENMKNGRVLDGTRIQELTPGSEGLFFIDVARDRRDACKMILGTVHSNEQKNFQYAWVHAFDDVLPTSDTQLWKKEATKTWMGRWFE